MKEIDLTDTINELKKGYGADFKKLKVKKGRVLTFDYEGSKTIFEITRTTKDGKYFAKEIELYEPNTVASHYHHNVDVTEETIREFGSPYCSDCETPVSEPASLEGKRRFERRKDNYLDDGTFIGDEE